MKPILPYLLSAALLGASFPALAQQKQTPPPGSAPHDFALPAKQEVTLPNGLRATLVPYGEIPKVTVELVVQAGNVHDPAADNGLADMVGRLLREGTTTLTAKEIADKVARMGGTLEVGVGSTQTTLYGSVLSEYAPDMVRLMADLVQHPAFPAAGLDRIKQDFKREMSLARAQPGTQARMAFTGALYQGHPYGRGLPTDATIDGYSLDKVRAFYQQQYGAQRTNVYVAGKFDAAAVQAAITTALSGWEKGPVPHIDLATPRTKSDLLVTDRPGAPQSTIVIGLPVVDPTNPDYTKLQVTNSLLGGSFGSRITRNIREDKGYTYSPYSSVGTRYRAADWSEVADVTTKETGNSLKEIVSEMEKLQKEAPSADELKGIQNYEAGLFVLRNSSPGGIINQLNFLQLHGLPDSYLTNQVQRIYSVTPAQVQQTAKQYLRPESTTIVVVGDKKIIDPQLKKFQAERRKAL